LNYVKNGETIFASKGENFDKSSTLAEYDIIKTLGEGGFGEVLLATHKRTKEKVAIKFIKASTRVMANEIDRSFAEAETLKNLRHKNIVRVLNCFSLSSLQVAFIMEYLDGGELLQYVLQRGKLTEDEAREFFKQIAEAISYCHRSKLIHCDLKLENILLEAKDSKVVKVVDFGISGLCTGLDSASGGSLDYMAPEYFNGKIKGVHPGVDVWAMGCMLYGMVTGKLPFAGGDDQKIIDRITSGKVEYDEAGKKLSKEIRHLIAGMLEVNHEHRMNVYDILDHPWINGQKMAESPEEEEEKNQIEKKATTNPVTIPLKKPGSRNSTLAVPQKAQSFHVKKNSVVVGIEKERSPKVTSSHARAPSSGRKSDLVKSGGKKF